MHTSIWRQNDLKSWVTSQNYKSDHITMNLHRFEVRTIKTTQNYESHQIIMHASIWRQNDLKSWVTSQNYKSDQITMNWIDLTSKRSKQRKTTKVINLQWIASIWCQKHQTNAKLQKIYFDEFASIWRENDQNNTKLRSDQIIMHCIDLTSKRSKELSYVPKLQKWSNYNELHRFDIKRSKMFSYFAKHSKQRKTTKVIKLQLIASIWCQKHQTNTKLHKIYFDEFASIWRENDLKSWGTS